MGLEDNQPNAVCPCGLSPRACKERHDRIEVDIRTNRKDARQDMRDSESRLREHIEMCEAHMLERLDFQKAIATEITDNIKASYKDGLNKLTAGINALRHEVDLLKEETKTIPTDNIQRLVALEDWKKSLPDLATVIDGLLKWRWAIVGIGLGSGATIAMMWKYFDHLAKDFDAAIKAAELLLK